MKSNNFTFCYKADSTDAFYGRFCFTVGKNDVLIRIRREPRSKGNEERFYLEKMGPSSGIDDEIVVDVGVGGTRIVSERYIFTRNDILIIDIVSRVKCIVKLVDGIEGVNQC